MELPVRVTILGEKPFSFDGAVVNLEPRALSLRSAVTLELRAPLKVESTDQLWMGQVVEINPDGQTWLAVVRIEHALRDTVDLMRLAKRFVGKLERAVEAKAPAVT
jgi:hypothetical protein